MCTQQCSGCLSGRSKKRKVNFNSLQSRLQNEIYFVSVGSQWNESYRYQGWQNLNERRDYNWRRQPNKRGWNLKDTEFVYEKSMVIKTVKSLKFKYWDQV